MAAPHSAGLGLEALLGSAVAALTGGAGDQHLGIAVSGGPDSMALIDIAARVFPGRVEAATVDHGLRAESAAEAEMVARWCHDRGIPHATLHPRDEVVGNVQQWARLRRYALLEEWRLARKLDWVCTAHHADDQLETMVMRLNRGAGVNGLAGIRARQGRVLRPLLAARRAELLAWAEDQRLPFVDDPSNSDPRFDRAAIRARLREADWLDPQAATRSAAALAEAEEALDWAVDQLERQYVRGEGDCYVLDRADFPREMIRRLLLRMFLLADPGAPSPRGDTLDRAIAAAMAGEQVSIGRLLLKGGKRWSVRMAPPRA